MGSVFVARVTATDACAKLCILDPDPACRENGFSWSVAGAYCHGYYYRTEEPLSNYCYSSRATVSECPETPFVVTEEDAVALVTYLRRGGLSPSPVLGTSPEPQDSFAIIPLINLALESENAGDQVKYAIAVLNQVRESVATHSPDRKGGKFNRQTASRWFDLHGSNFLAIAERLDPMSSRRDKILLDAYITLISGVTPRKSSQAKFLRATGLNKMCNETPNRLMWLIKHDVSEWPTRDLISAGLSAYNRNLKLFEYCPNMFVHDATARSVIYLDRLQKVLVQDDTHGYQFHDLQIRRPQTMKESFEYLVTNPMGPRSQFDVNFIMESGYGQGTVSEWFTELSTRIVKHFFIPVNGEHVFIGDIAKSRPNHELEMIAIGTFLALSFRDRVPIPLKLPLRYYARILGLPITLNDIRKDEPGLFASFRVMLTTDLTSIPVDIPLELSFPDADSVQLTNENKQELINRKLNSEPVSHNERKLLKKIREGFNSILLTDQHNEDALISASVLRDVTFGEPLNVAELKKYVSFEGGYTNESEPVVWLFRMLNEFDDSRKAEFLKFVIASPVLPLGGVAYLESPIVVRKVTYRAGLMPSTRTCFKTFDLPEYRSEDELRAAYDRAVALALTMED